MHIAHRAAYYKGRYHTAVRRIKTAGGDWTHYGAQRAHAQCT